MTKSEITQKLAHEYHLAPRHARLVVDALFNNIIASAMQGECVILRGFGTFSVKVLRARQSRNPRTGEEISVKERRSLHFKPGRVLYSRMNNG